MDDLEKPSAEQASLKALQDQCESLRQLVSALLLVLLLVSGTLTIFLQRQWRFTKSELEMLSAQATPIVTEFNRNWPLMQDFVRKLDEYGKTHPDFAPIAARYPFNQFLGIPAASSGTNGLAGALSGKH